MAIVIPPILPLLGLFYGRPIEPALSGSASPRGNCPKLSATLHLNNKRRNIKNVDKNHIYLVFVAKPPRAMIKELRIHFFSTPSRRFRTARNLEKSIFFYPILERDLDMDIG